jgi:hypothetical protein
MAVPLRERKRRNKKRADFICGTISDLPVLRQGFSRYALAEKVSRTLTNPWGKDPIGDKEITG